MIMLAGRRLAKKVTSLHSCGRKNESFVQLCMNACRLAEDAKMNVFKVIARRPAMTRTHCSTTLKIFKLEKVEVLIYSQPH